MTPSFSRGAHITPWKYARRHFGTTSQVKDILEDSGVFFQLQIIFDLKACNNETNKYQVKRYIFLLT